MSTKAKRPIHTFPPLALEPIVIREATHADREALRRLGQRDSAPAPADALLVGEVGGEIRAAVPLDGGRSIADPFHRTADLLALLHARVDQIRSSRRRELSVVARSATPGVPRRAVGQAA